MKTTIEELLYAADAISHLPKIRDFEQDALQDELNDSAWLSEIEADLDVVDVIAHTTVSDAVRKECEAELGRSGHIPNIKH
jgi:hypothetical protein